MKEYKEVTKTEIVTKKELVHTKCDLCGKLSTGYSWGRNRFETEETKIEVAIAYKTGKDYPEGGYGHTYEIDMCPDCFKNKLIPWMKSEGAHIEPTEYDW